MEKRRQVLLNYIPEEEEAMNVQLPDTPMFRHANKVILKGSSQINRQQSSQMKSSQQASSSGSLKLPDSVDSEPETGASASNEPHNKGTGSRIESMGDRTTEASLKMGRSKSTLEISSDGELERLRKTNRYNQKLICELTGVIKQLQSKVDCYELSNNELRLQLLERTGECSALKDFIQTLRYQHTEEHVTLKGQIMLLQDRLHRQEQMPGLDRPSTDSISGVQPVSSQLASRKKLREIMLKNSLMQSSIDSGQKPPSTGGSSFKLKSFRNSLSNLREDSSVDRSREKQNTFEQQPQQLLREQLQRLQYRVDHLADQQKLLSFKNSFLQMKIVK